MALTNLTPQRLKQWIGAVAMEPVDDSDVYRTAIYFDHLVDAHDNLVAAAKSVEQGGLGAFVADALKDANLLTRLAEILDGFVCYQVNEEMKRATPAFDSLENYYLGCIFDNANGIYSANMTAFFTRYPRTKVALDQITANFVANIFSCCRRVLFDRQKIRQMFSADATLTALVNILPTGSDFHKGGTQVLILTFKTSATKEIKVVYKPSDVEIDCLLVGDSAAVNRLMKDFMVYSLAELFNEALSVMQREGRCVHALPLPTYKILPRCCMSRERSISTPPFTNLRDLYGYIEFIEYYTDKENILQNYASRWLITSYIVSSFGSPHSAEKIISDFYQIIGQLTAVVWLFSMRDLHVENLIVHERMPYLIDLENAISQKVTQVEETGFYASDTVPAAPPRWENSSVQGLRSEKNLYRIENHRYHEYQDYLPCGNRLWLPAPVSKVVAPEPLALLRGIDDGFDIIVAIPAKKLRAWWRRLDNVLVRVIPLGTNVFANLISKVFREATDQITHNLQTAMTNRINSDIAAEGATNPPLAGFAVLAAASTCSDLMDLDVPVFYRKVSQLEIVDSYGKEVLFGPTINIPNNPPRNTGRSALYQTNPRDDLSNEISTLRSNPTSLAQIKDTVKTQVKHRLGCGDVVAPNFRLVPDAGQGTDS